MGQQQVRVEIGGRAYNLVSADTERTRRLARKVDDTICRFANRLGEDAGNYQLAILAALHIADELEIARAEHQRYRSGIGTAVRDLLAQLQSASDGINDDVDALRAEGSRAGPAA